MEAIAGAGAATVSVTAVGTAAGRDQLANTIGTHVALAVACFRRICSFRLGMVPMLDGDGTSFGLRIDAQQGQAYTVQVKLAPGLVAAAEVHLTIYYPGGVSGAGGFAKVVGDPLGDWIRTPPGHHSFGAVHGCADGDRACFGVAADVAPTFGHHPEGGAFGHALRGTWAAPAAGTALVQVAANCDVSFFADVESESEHYVQCATHLTLSVTAGAHFADAAATSPTVGVNDRLNAPSLIVSLPAN